MADDYRLRDFLGPRYWPSWLGLAVLRLLAFLPLPVVAATGALLGELLYWVMGDRRHITRTNIHACFSELTPSQRRRLARAHFRAFAQATFAVPIAWWGSRTRLQRLVRWQGDEPLRAALAEGRPVILLVAHFVGIELGGMALSTRYPLVDMYKRPRNLLFDYLIRRCRIRFGGRLVERREGIKPVIRAMRDGIAFFYLSDQDQGRSGAVFVPFFGIPTATLTGLARLATATRAQVIPCFTRQLPWGQGYELIFQPPLEHFPTEDATADTARMNAIIEDAVRAMPEQYFWSHRRFKTRPEGEPPFY
jgi:KDO2-lipid IV(A) lauroyltransferase